MRRLFLTIFALGFFLGLLTGCQNFICHTAGICDCDHDDDPCTHRAPWVVRSVPPPYVAPVAVGSAPTQNVPVTNVSRTN